MPGIPAWFWVQIYMASVTGSLCIMNYTYILYGIDDLRYATLLVATEPEDGCMEGPSPSQSVSTACHTPTHRVL